LARVVVPKRFVQHCDGRETLEVAAVDVRALFRALADRFPALAAELDAKNVAIAIDGEIVNEPLLERLEPESEVHFLARVSGG